MIGNSIPLDVSGRLPDPLPAAKLPNPKGAHDNPPTLSIYQGNWLSRRAMVKEIQSASNSYAKGLLLDVGCGVGTFLKLAEEQGFDVQGTEISEFAVKYVKNSLKIDVFKGDLEEAHFPEDSFDVVTIWHTLEHIPDPMAALKEINRLLKKDGLLVVAVPNLNNYITRISYLLGRGKKLMLFSVKAKEWHLYHFSAKTLSAMLEKTGFEIKKIGMDLAQIELQKKIVDYLAILTRFFTGRNFGEALKIFAVKT